MNEDTTFIDLFAGCGGLSLGLMNAGWKGLFAIEGNPDAFKTLKHNLIDKGVYNSSKPLFDWPEWLGKEHIKIGRFIKKYRSQLNDLRGVVRLVAGGPPCQGFSWAGKRKKNDSRNELFKYYLEIVHLIQPDFVLIENVKGIGTAHGTIRNQKGKRNRGRPRKSYLKRIISGLQLNGNVSYDVNPYLVRAVNYGVPQIRQRYIIVGVRNGALKKGVNIDINELLEEKREEFLKGKGLPIEKTVSVEDAISDLKTIGKKMRTCKNHHRFKEIIYKGPETQYQELMHGSTNGNQPNSLRLPNHQEITVARFKEILDTCPKGVTISKENREKLGIKKQVIVPLNPDKPSHTLTTLPDDLLHYSEPRIHTVREHARLQSFPDWFEFKGNYTTGGKRRRRECPRYTQVGNAVPPLLAEAVGEVLLQIISELQTTSLRSTHLNKSGKDKGMVTGV